jgi:putative chitinase
MLTSMQVLNAAGVRNMHPNYKAAFEKADREGIWKDYDIDEDIELIHFLAQAGPETGYFTVIRENMNYSASRLVQIFGVNKHSAAVTAAEASRLAGNPQAIAERVYGLGNPRKAHELGNNRPGDGYRFRGGGPLQLTGGGAYKRTGEEMGIDLYGNPDLIADPDYILIPSLIHWRSRKISAAAKANNIQAVTKLVNGGLNGYADRVAFFNKLWAASKKISPVKAATSTDPEMLQLQKDLNALGASPQLTEDGIFGSQTELAIKAFQKANGLRVDGIAGDQTKAAIKNRLSPGGVSQMVSETPAVSNAATTPTNVTGGTLTTVGLVIDQLMEKSQAVKSFIGDNVWLQYAVGGIVVVGLGFIAYGFIRKYLSENRALIKT